VLTPLSESSGGRSLTDLHKDLDTIFTSSTPPKIKSTATSGGSGGKTRKIEQLSSSYAMGQLSPCLPAMSRIKSLSRISLLDVPATGGGEGRSSSGGGSGELPLDMYHTVSGDLMSASRPAIPFARITTTNRRQPQQASEMTAALSAANPERLEGGCLPENEWGSLQGLSEEVWRVSAASCPWAGQGFGSASLLDPCILWAAGSKSKF